MINPIKLTCFKRANKKKFFNKFKFTKCDNFTNNPIAYLNQKIIDSYQDSIQKILAFTASKFLDSLKNKLSVVTNHTRPSRIEKRRIHSFLR